MRLFVMLVVASLTLVPSIVAGEELKKLGFGPALVVRWNVNSPDQVAAASIDANGIVRVDRRVDTNAGLALEVHAFPRGWQFHSHNMGIGPFAYAQPGTEDLFVAVGAGLMWGCMVSESGKAMTVGVGYACVPQATVLGEEFVPGRPAPTDSAGEPLPIRYQTRDKGAVLFLCGFSF